MTIEHRSYELDLELRAEGDGRTICGIVVPYNVEQRINGQLTEVFRPGAFAAVTRAAHRVKLLVSHDQAALPIGRATELRETDAGLYGEFRVSKTDRGDQILELVRDEALTEFSIGFAPLRDKRTSTGVVERLKAHLAEVSLVTFGAYGANAVVSAVREEQAGRPNLEAARLLLEQLRK